MLHCSQRTTFCCRSESESLKDWMTCQRIVMQIRWESDYTGTLWFVPRTKRTSIFSSRALGRLCNETGEWVEVGGHHPSSLVAAAIKSSPRLVHWRHFARLWRINYQIRRLSLNQGWFWLLVCMELHLDDLASVGGIQFPQVEGVLRRSE